jgi:hypothetical protein
MHMHIIPCFYLMDLSHVSGRLVSKELSRPVRSDFCSYILGGDR